MTSSPCTKVCKIKEGICTGCHRTLEQIGAWGSMTEQERQEAMAKMGYTRPTSCSEIPNSSGHASRQALEGEPVAWWDGDMSAAEDSFSFKSNRCYTIPLYTHPASRQAVSVPEETLTAIHDTLRLVWSRELSADDGMDEIEILIPPTKADEWIKCSERLPSEADHYLVALSDPEDVGWVTDKAWTAFYNKGGEWDCCEAVEDGQPVTHWMPLPCPPKQEKGNG